MTALKAHEVTRFLARPDLTEGVFLAYGPDGGLVRETAQRLIRYLSGDDPASADVFIFDGPELDAEPGRLITEARSTSLFGGKRIIRVRNASKSLVMPLTELRDDPGGTAIVLEAGNLAPRDALRALVEAAKLGRALPCYPDTDETLTNLMRETFNQAGIRVDSDVVPTLREILGNDREITRRELEKLTLFAASTKSLTREDVLTLCADNGALAIDAILDATGGGHAEKLEMALNRALTSSVNPQQLLAMLTNHFASLRRWRVEVDAGKSPRPARATAPPLDRPGSGSSLGALATGNERQPPQTRFGNRNPAPDHPRPLHDGRNTLISNVFHVKH